MRTTLDIDDVVLSAARGLADAKGVSLGRAVSELALRGLRGEGGGEGRAATSVDVMWPGFVPLPGTAALHSAPQEELKELVLEDELEDDLRHAGPEES